MLEHILSRAAIETTDNYSSSDTKNATIENFWNSEAGVQNDADVSNF